MQAFQSLLMGVAMGVLVGAAFFIISFSVVWYVLKRQWEKLAKEILELGAWKAQLEAQRKAQKDKINEDADGIKSQPAVDAANRIIQE